MNTNALAKHYGSLTPRERLPLITAASLRGDDTEWQRLVLSAPKVTYSVPHHFGFATAVGEVSNLHFMEALHLSALLLGAHFATLASGNPELAPPLAHRLRAHLGGWRAFCSALPIDPELLWSCLPGYDTVKLADKVAEERACSAEEYIAIRRKQGHVIAVLPTDADVAAGLRDTLATRAEWWG